MITEENEGGYKATAHDVFDFIIKHGKHPEYYHDANRLWWKSIEQVHYDNGKRQRRFEELGELNR